MAALLNSRKISTSSMNTASSRSDSHVFCVSNKDTSSKSEFQSPDALPSAPPESLINSYLPVTSSDSPDVQSSNGVSPCQLVVADSNLSNTRKTSIELKSEYLFSLIQELQARSPDNNNDVKQALLHARSLIDEQTAGQNNPNDIICPSTWTSSNNQSTANVRFRLAADQVRDAEPQDTRHCEYDNSPNVDIVMTYEEARDLERARVFMLNESRYKALARNQGHIELPEIQTHILDMQIMPIRTSCPNLVNTSNNMMRYTVASNGNGAELCIWSRQINVHAERLSKPSFLSTDRSSRRQTSDNLDDKDIEHRVYVKLPESIKSGTDASLQIRYVRFYAGDFYLTGIVKTTVSCGQPIPDHRQDPGILLRCTGPDPSKHMDHSNENTFSGNESNKSSSPNSQQLFPITAYSDLIPRDQNGYRRLDEPTIMGLDIDRTTGDIFAAFPANRTIYRFNHETLRIVSCWYFMDPKLSPTYLCVVSARNELWATCMAERKMVIVDICTGRYNYFPPKDTARELHLSHIIYTTDHRIIVLDSNENTLCWLKRVGERLNFQTLDLGCIRRGNHSSFTSFIHSFASSTSYSAQNTNDITYTTGNTNNKTNNNFKANNYNDCRCGSTPSVMASAGKNHLTINVIQPVEDMIAGGLTETLNEKETRKLHGGIMCADSKGAFLVYPEKLLPKPQSAFLKSWCSLATKLK